MLPNTAIFNAWPPLPYTYALDHTSAHLLFDRSLSPIGNDTETALACRLFSSEIDLLTAQPRLFSVGGMSLARKFTETYLKCFSTQLRLTGGKWTLEIAIAMLTALHSLIWVWGIRDFEFGIWEGETKLESCRVWVVSPFGGQYLDLLETP